MPNANELPNPETSSVATVRSPRMNCSARFSVARRRSATADGPPGSRNDDRMVDWTAAATKKLAASIQIALVAPTAATSTPGDHGPDDLGTRRQGRQEPVRSGESLGPDERRDGTEHGRVGEHERRRRQQCHDEDLGDREHAEQMGDRDRRHQRALDEVAADDQAATVASIGDRAGDESEQQIRHDPQREQRPGLRGRPGGLVDDERQDDAADRRTEHRDALRRGPAHERRLGPQRRLR